MFYLFIACGKKFWDFLALLLSKFCLLITNFNSFVYTVSTMTPLKEDMENTKGM